MCKTPASILHLARCVLPARQLNGPAAHSPADVLRAIKAAPQAAFVPPDPILKFYAERRINAIERDSGWSRAAFDLKNLLPEVVIKKHLMYLR